VRIVLTNNLPEATSIHWHGMPVPYDMDGMTPVAPGDSFTYEFTAPAAGSYMYHSHIESDKQVMVGLYAPFIVEPAEPEENPPAVDVMWLLSEWRMIAGETYPAMPMTDGDPNYFTINGKAYPSTEKIVVKQGETVRIRIAAIGQFAHPMHLHGMNFRIVGYDGVTLRPEQQIVRNTVTVNPGEIVDIEFTADNLGTWMFHCHILHHVTNDGVEPGGLLAIVEMVE
jgi:FtsP/CotA-like multicopper oxidase with cupredoxin domain